MRAYRDRSCAALWCAAVGLVGCSSPPASDGVQQPIYAADDGIVTEDDRAHPQVFTLFGVSGCTAALVASNAVLTAAHCATAPGRSSEYESPFVKTSGQFNVNVRFNAPPDVAAQLPEMGEWRADSADIHPRPDFGHMGAASADVAVAVMPTSIPRCAMKPLKVVDRIPSPALLSVHEGTVSAWSGMHVLAFGAGLRDAACSSGFGASMRRLRTEVIWLEDHPLPPNRSVFLMMPGGGDGASGSHTCGGDSGGPILTTGSDDIGTNIPPGQVMSLIAGRRDGSINAPVLQDPSIRPWLTRLALDRDGDGVEAADDNCDTVANPGQVDSDRDGIGDVCDAVPGIEDCEDWDEDGLPNYADACWRDRDHRDSDGDGLPDCADPCPRDPTNSDPDRDGLCDPDDNCPRVANPGQENCNIDAENVKLAPPVGDACDPVPCVRATPTSRRTPSPYVRVTRTTYFDVEPIRAVAGASGPPFVGEWAHRFCPCDVADGTSAAPSACAMQRGCVISADFSATDGNWNPTRVGIDAPPALDARFNDTFSTPREQRPGGAPATRRTLTWDSDNEDQLAFRVRGSHWFHVVREICPQGRCASPAVANETLEDLANHYWAGELGQYIARPTVALPTIPRIFSWWMPPPPICPMCGSLEVLPFAHLLSDGTLAIRAPAGDYAIEEQLTAAAARALKAAARARWLAPSEPARWLDGAAVRLASIAPDGSGAGPALRVTAGRLDVVNGDVRQGPAPRSRFGAVLRATEGDLIVVGGVLANGAPARDLWRFAIDAGRWNRVPLRGAPELGAVLAATYDAGARRLLVLDEVGASPRMEARLWSIELASGATRQLGAWPRFGVFHGFELGHADDGSVVLVATDGQGVLHVVRLIVGPTGVVLERAGAIQGTAVAPPRTDPRGIHVVAASGGQIAGELIPWSSLRAPGARTLADFVK